MKREGGTSSRFKLLIFKAILKQFLFFWVQLRPTIPSLIRRVLSGMILSVLVVFPLFFLGLDGFVRRDARDNVGGYRKIAYYYEQTVAVMGYRSKIPIDCDLVMAEMSDIDEKKRLFNDIRRGTQSMKEISFAEMMSLVRLCNDLEKESQPTHHGASQPNDQPTNEPPATMTSLLSGIFPGTKWCGINDIAVDYHDLGIEEDLDRCCRTHDHCPIKVKAFNSNYGLFNIHPYTKSHCECDSELYDCLKKIENTTNSSSERYKRVQAIGNIYFNIMSIQCIEPKYPATCLEIRAPNGTTLHLGDEGSKTPPKRRSRRSLNFTNKAQSKRDQCLKWAINPFGKPKYFQSPTKRSF